MAAKVLIKSDNMFVPLVQTFVFQTKQNRCFLRKGCKFQRRVSETLTDCALGGCTWPSPF